jgi:hypothetical protein
MTLTRNALKTLKEKKPATEISHINGWDADICIRRMSAGDSYDLYTAFHDEDDTLTAPDRLKRNRDRVLRMVICSVVDETTGEPLFTDADRDWLLSQSPETYNELTEAVLRINGITPKTEEVAEKNSDKAAS